MLSRTLLRPILSSSPSSPLRLSRTISSSSRRSAEVAAVPPQDLVQQNGGRSIGPASEADPQLDGYPELPYISLQKRNAKGWWDNQERRNYGETLHEQDDALNMWSPDTPSQNPSWAFTQLILAFTAIGGFGYMMYLTKMERPVSKRSYPFEGLREELGGGEMGVKAIAESAEEDEE